MEVCRDLVLKFACVVRDVDNTEDARPRPDWIDLGTRGDSIPENLPENALFAEGGITLCKHNQCVTLRAFRHI